MSIRQGLLALLASIVLGMVDAGAQTLPEVTLPDLTGIHPSVQKQLTQAYTVHRLWRRHARVRATFGERHFMVTRFNDEAERFFERGAIKPQTSAGPTTLTRLRNAGDLSGAPRVSSAPPLRSTDFQR
jgi:hypothetical protein